MNGAARDGAHRELPSELLVFPWRQERLAYVDSALSFPRIDAHFAEKSEDDERRITDPFSWLAGVSSNAAGQAHQGLEILVSLLGVPPSLSRRRRNQSVCGRR
eukprot:1201689-Pyramimonas_sp.AAC.1